MSTAKAATSFTVVVPLFQKRDYVERTLRAVFAQTLSPAQVIVVDDGSTDGGADLVADRFPQVTLIRQPNAGVSAARNHGIREATGDWIALLDADDVWMPWHLAELDRIVSAVPAARLVSSRIREVPHTDDLPALARSDAPPREVDYFAEVARRPHVVTASTVAIRRETLEAVGGFGPWKLCEDLELWARVALSHPVAISEVETALYIRGIGGATDSLGSRGGHRETPERIDDVDASCATVSAALRSGRHHVPVGSLRRYLDARLLTHVKVALVTGNTRRARRMFRLMSPEARVRALPLLPFALLPSRVGRTAARQAFRLRRALASGA